MSFFEWALSKEWPGAQSAPHSSRRQRSTWDGARGSVEAHVEGDVEGGLGGVSPGAFPVTRSFHCYFGICSRSKWRTWGVSVCDCERELCAANSRTMRTLLRSPCISLSSLAPHRVARSLSLSSSNSRLFPCPVPSAAAISGIGVIGGARRLGFVQFRGQGLSRCFAAMALEKIKVENPIVEMDGMVLVSVVVELCLGRNLLD